MFGDLRYTLLSGARSAEYHFVWTDEEVLLRCSYDTWNGMKIKSTTPERHFDILH